MPLRMTMTIVLSVTSAELIVVRVLGALANCCSLNCPQLDERDDAFVAVERYVNYMDICRHGERKTVNHSQFPASIGEIDEKVCKNTDMRESWSRHASRKKGALAACGERGPLLLRFWHVVEVLGAVVRYRSLLMRDMLIRELPQLPSIIM
jgi:hypothetical protein